MTVNQEAGKMPGIHFTVLAGDELRRVVSREFPRHSDYFLLPTISISKNGVLVLVIHACIVG